MAYVYIESYTDPDGSRRCMWAIGGSDVPLNPPLGHTFQQVAGPLTGLDERDRWIETEGVKLSGGKLRGQGGWSC
jgi:hypothetical protein